MAPRTMFITAVKSLFIAGILILPIILSIVLIRSPSAQDGTPMLLKASLPPFSSFASALALYTIFSPDPTSGLTSTSTTTSPPRSSLPHWLLLFTLLTTTLWLTALTPSRTPPLPSTIHIPRFIASPWTASPTLIRSNLGTSSYTPQFHAQSALLAAAADSQRRFPTHPRLDQSGYVFAGRSHGLGASPGLSALSGIPARDWDRVRYTYRERGPRVGVRCARNESSRFTVEKRRKFWRDAISLYDVRVELPNMGEGEAWGIEEPASDSFFFKVVGHSGRGEHVVALAATENRHGYGMLHGVQCRLGVAPWEFEVGVDARVKRIQVEPVRELEGWPEDAEAFFEGSLAVFEQIAGETMKAAFANAFAECIARAWEDAFGWGEWGDGEAMLRSVESVLESLLDDYAVAIGEAQVLMGKVSAVDAEVVVENGRTRERAWGLGVCLWSVGTLVVGVVGALKRAGASKGAGVLQERDNSEEVREPEEQPLLAA